MSEDKIQRGQRSAELLKDPLLSETLELIKTTILETWVSTTESEAREELWYTLKGLERFKGILEQSVEEGSFELTLKEKDNAKTSR